jgi:hypothetical protein
MKKITLKIFLITFLFSSYSFVAKANVNGGDWKPQIVEKMFVLPPQHLDKVLNNDFKSSLLASNLKITDNKIKSKTDKITELKSYLPGATKDEILEIKHQIIINKRDYIKDMNDLLIMKKQKLKTKKQFFEKIKNNIKYNKKSEIYKSDFLNNKNAALQRAQKLDFKILEKTSLNLTQSSKYFKQYEINKKAIEKLRVAIKNHPMNDKSILANSSGNKLEALENYIYNIETEMAVLEMKEQMMSYMAKIVALDAMNLAENVSGINQSKDGNNSLKYNDPANAIDLFTNL